MGGIAIPAEALDPCTVGFWMCTRGGHRHQAKTLDMTTCPSDLRLGYRSIPPRMLIRLSQASWCLLAAPFKNTNQTDLLEKCFLLPSSLFSIFSPDFSHFTLP